MKPSVLITRGVRILVAVVAITWCASFSFAELRVYVAGGNPPPVGQPSGAFVSMIRVADNSVLATRLLPSPMDAGHSIKIHPNGLKAYASGRGGVLARIDPTTLTITGTIPIPESNTFGLAFTPDGTQALVCTASSTVRRINALTDTSIDLPISVSGSALDIVINSAGTRAYVGTTGTVGYIDVIDLTLPSPAVINTLNLGGINQGNIQVLALSPDQSLLYVTDAGNNLFRVFRTSDLVEVTPASYNPAGRFSYPRSLSISPDHTLAYIGNRFGPPNENSIRALRLSDGAIVWTVQDPDIDPDPGPGAGTSNPRTSVLTPDGSMLYVTLHGRSAVAAIRTSDHTYSYLTVLKAPVGSTIADVADGSGVPLMSSLTLLIFILAILCSGIFIARTLRLRPAATT